MDLTKVLGALLQNNSMGSNVLGSLLGGAGGGGGGGGALGALGSLLGGGGGGGAGGGLGALGSLLGGGGGGDALGALGALLGGGQPQAQAAPQPPSAESNSQAEILIRAMCNAAKSDGRFDQNEQQNILGKLGDDVDQAEVDFIRNELAQPLDVNGFARSVPSGMEQQAYAFSVMAIKLDEQSEAQYLGQLAQGLRLDPNVCNQIHEQLGAPQIFR